MPAGKIAARLATASPTVSMERLAEQTREMIQRRFPRLRIEPHWAGDWFVGTDLICCVGEFTHHVGVEFWRGSTVPDSDQLLEGTGKNLRHVKLRSPADATSQKFAQLVRRAVALDRASSKRTR